MDKSEFERIKAEEKAHLRKLRALKEQYRGVSRQKKVLDALSAMQRPDLDRTHEQTLRKLTEDAAMTEARLEIAMEAQGAEPPEPEPLTKADRENLRKAEAAALIRQMKAEMGGLGDEASDAPTPSEPGASDRSGSGASAPDSAEPERTIGRSPAAPSDLVRDDQKGTADASDAPPPTKTIGRHRDAT